MNIVNDKMLHVLAGAALGVIGLLIAGPVGGLALAALGGVGKELIDRAGYGTADVYDALATVAGGVAAVVLLALVGCTTVDHSYREPTWPADMRTIEHYVPEREMRDRCGKYTGPFASPMACAEWDYGTRECHIYYSADFPPPASIVEHERLHCQGYIRHGNF